MLGMIILFYFENGLQEINYSSQKIQIQRMEDSSKLSLKQRISVTLSKLKLKSEKLDQVSAHCRQDHITSNHLEDRMSRSLYKTNFSPPKMLPDYNRPIPEKELQQFRKSQSSTLLLPSILNNSQYQNSFKQSSQQKVTKSKEKQSWFLKGEWAMKPASDYQENFGKKNGSQFNKTNHLRSNYSTLTIFKLRQGQKGVSNYEKDFKGYLLKKQSKLSIGNRDHLNGKENCTIQTGLTEYQRRYDSVFQVPQQRNQMKVCLYGRQNFIKRTSSKNKL